MNFTKIAILFNKCFSLYLFYRFVAQIPLVVSLFLGDYSYELQIGWLYLSPPILHLGLGILFWIFSKPIGEFMTKEIGIGEGSENEVDYHSLEVIAFSIIGILMVAIVIPKLTTSSIQLLGLRNTYSHLGRKLSQDPIFMNYFSEMIGNLAQLLIGIILLLKAKGIVNVVRSLRKA